MQGKSLRHAGDLVCEARRIISTGDGMGITVRSIGGVAVRLLTGGSWLATLDRAPGRDIDLAGLAQDRSRYLDAFSTMGYQTDETIHVATEGRRFAFVSRASGIEIDLFVDRLEMSHVVEWGDRLRLSSPTVTPADVLLQKLQIHDIDDKDTADIMALLLALPFDEESHGMSPRRLTSVLADDWGFWYTANDNLRKVTNAVTHTRLDQPDQTMLLQQVKALRQLVDSTPKTRRWRRRALIGTRRQWYNEVSDDVEIY